MRSPFTLFALAVLAGLAAILVVATALLAAPLPKTEAPPRPLAEAIVGHWDMSWGGVPYVVSIDADGCWDCRGNSTLWVGGVKAEGSTLYLTESTWDAATGTAGPQMEFEIQMGADLSGVTTSGTRVRFVRRVE